MVVEEVIKGSENEEEIGAVADAVPWVHGADEEDEAIEEGEIVGDADSTSSKQSAGLVYQFHPLEYSWTFWFDSPSAKTKQVVWGTSIRPIYTLATVEEFWGVYNNIHHPSKLAVRADLYCFKDKVEPKWEDPVCADGGKWTVSYQRGKSDSGWLNTLLAMIGEQFDHGDEICGVVVNVRPKEEKISLWTKNASNKEAQISIGKQWKEFLDYNESIGFIGHDDAIKFDRFAKNRYTI